MGPQTKWGRALGSTQMLPDTAREMAGKLGLPFREDLLRSNDPTALRYQRALGEAYLREGIDRTGNVRDGLRYYHGGPDRRQWGPKTNSYADQVLGRLRGY
jgi:soluble lytic murein transglycosylase